MMGNNDGRYWDGSGASGSDDFFRRADENRLTRERDEARAEVERLTRERDEARAEVERLRAENARLRADVPVYSSMIERQRNENACLRAEVPVYSSVIKQQRGDIERLTHELDEAKAKLIRLSWILCDPDGNPSFHGSDRALESAREARNKEPQP